MKKHFTLTGLIIFCLAIKFSAQTYVPFPATGYTLDGVAENTTALVTTAGAMDASNFNLYSQYYGTLYGSGAVGLPNNGTIVSGQRTYQLQPYNSGNVFFLPANTQDSLAFVTPQPFPAISLLSFATQGNAVINVKVRFTDNTTEVFTGISVVDWFTANPSVYNGFDRVLRTTGVPAYVGSAGNPRMFGTDLPILCANQGKLIKNVAIQNTSTAFFCVMAVAGMVPAYSVNGNTSICSSGTSTLNATGFATYTWQPVGSFAGSNAATINVTPSSPTTYTLLGTDGSGCPGYTTIAVSINSGPPVLSLSGSTQTVCLGAAATLTASGAATYTWTGGVTNGVPFYPTASGSYTVSGENGCGITTSVSAINVGPIPVSVASTATAICTNKTATLTVTASANSYTIFPQNTVTSNSVIIVNPQVTTVYTVAASNGTCYGANTFSLQADPVPTIVASVNTASICPGESVTLMATGGNNYTWTPINQNGGTITIVPAVTTLYSVSGDNNFGCLNNATQLVVVGTQPTVMISASSATVCTGSLVTFTATGANTYTWTGGPQLSIYAALPTQFSTYTVTGTNVSSGCIDSETVSVNVFSPSVTINGNATVCAGSAASFTANGASGYTWSPGNLPFATFNPIPTANTVYTVNALASNGALSCPASATVQVVVNPNPTITAAMSPTAICPKQSATLTANGAGTYTWTDASSGTVAATSLTLSSNKGAVFIYTLTGTNSFGCQSNITVPVTVSACTGIDEETLAGNQLAVYPNPNNGEFVVQSQRPVNLYVINQLGQVIKQLDLKGENGHKMALSNVSEGVYFIVGDGVRMKVVVGK